MLKIEDPLADRYMSTRALGLLSIPEDFFGPRNASRSVWIEILLR